MPPKFFKRSDYMSDQGMVTSVWGPALWHVLHAISFNYPMNPTNQQKRDYKKFLLALGKVLPCGSCRDNFPINCNKIGGITNDVLENRDKFSRFIYNLHCSVNKSLGKKPDKECNTFCKVRDRYEHFRAKCPKKLSRKRRHAGCTRSMRGSPLKCVLEVIPRKSRKKSFRMKKR